MLSNVKHYQFYLNNNFFFIINLNHNWKVFANNYSYDQNMPKDFGYQIDVWIDILNQIDINYHNFRYPTSSFQRSIQLIKYFKAKLAAIWTVRWKVIIWLCIELFEETLSCCYWIVLSAFWSFWHLYLHWCTIEIIALIS